MFYELLESTVSLCLARKWYEKMLILLAAVNGRTSLEPIQRVLPLCFGFKNALDMARLAMGSESFERAWQTGRSMNYQELCVFACNLFEVNVGKQVQDEALSMLTARELNVLRLLAQGKSNNEVSRELVVVQKTVEKHVANILRKLAVKNRTEAAAWAIERNLAK